MSAFEKREEAFALSPQQRSQWLAGLPAARLELEIKGPLALERLQQRLVALSACHEALRLRVRPEPGLLMPLQVIESTVMAANAFNVEVQAIGADHHQVTLQLPALSADRGTLLRLAQALGSTDAPSVDDEAMTYTQYSAWLYELQADEDAEPGRRFWASQALDELAASELLYRQVRSDCPDAPVTTRLDANPSVSMALDSFCQRHDASPEQVLMTAWGVLLQRLSTGDSPALTLNWVHDCRDDYEELADCWGLFAKPLPLRWQPAADSHFAQALANLQVLCEQATEWQEYCGVSAAQPGDAPQYGFQWGGQLPERLDTLGNLASTLTVLDAQAIPAGMELLLVAETTAGGYRLNLCHLPSRYSEQAALVLLEQFQSLLLDALANPGKPLAELSLQSPSFTATLAALQAPVDVAALPFTSVPARFDACAAQFPEHLALRDHSGPLSYAQLQARSSQLARYLRAQGVGREDRVALYLDRSSQMVLAMLAVLKSGAAFIPLDVHQPAQRSLAILQQAQPVLVLSGSAGSAPALPGIGSLDLRDEATWQQAPTTPVDVEIQSQDAAYVLFTSGSTGTPKGVIVEHRQLASYVASVSRRLALAPGERSAVVTSLAADLGYTLLFPALLSGGELHLLDKETAMDAQAWAAWQAQYPIDHLKIVPSLLDAWLIHAQSAAVLPRKQLILGGESCSRRLLQSIRGLAPTLALFNHYGPTETAVGVVMHKAEPAMDYRRLPLSDRLDGMRLYLLDEQQALAAPGQSAELYIAGPQLARGYLDAQQSAGRFIELAQLPGERLYRTGDLARYRHDGSLEITGRADRQVKIRGFRVELDEIQAQLTGLPGVAQAAVECIPRGELGQQLFAFMTLAPGHSTTVARLHGQAQDCLPDYMLPTLRIVEALPLMGNGKLDRKTLQQWADKVLDTVGSALPRTPLEALLADVWAQVLGLERVGIDDDFFELGGHSLAAVTLASRLQTALAAPVTVNAVFNAPSVSAFAALVQAELKLSPLVRLSAPNTVEAANLFCFHPSTGHVQDYRTLLAPLSGWRLWGLQAAYLSDDSTALGGDIKSLGALYVEHLRQQQPQGPYHLLGFSLGGLLAIAAAARLESQGEEVAFLGIIDSQYQHQAPEDSVEALLESASQALTPDSQAVLRQLPPPIMAALLAQLDALSPAARLPELVQWARQQGLQLDGDSWEHLQTRLRYQQHTQHLLATFQPARLSCPVHVWWASDTLAQPDFADPQWERLSSGPLTREVIAAQHLTILEQRALHEQLAARLTAIATHGAV
ncbi:non-ribosomal peptide synthetase [Pseudomonas brassicacearum]|uniref:non-ribosomal peptide synthetase n=1 Tax=Pseudomonas brassicacearum TaxID=930166 RepID=UPI00025FFC5A|nr:non-ribosomal peptide synthetase [Pseudomonas brassicacearum]EIK65151.1 non-ribosomal peptide synthetase, putative [Pseudomonas fluorescens Q8r1-96]KAB0528174.1 non-ribosomal peptide synthetase [Pseudomonas brassicacearum subsp. brassicacearum]NJP59624.1 non-ribosomal peptide synthetase [Pseudomonas brassicacearum]QEO78303.1 non-ribosomal peptide synthetase [Pseudomonas brassicacearum]SDP33983.1 amino acid adenylation domain-containing protein [Pseudomonas brassicacearum]